MKATMNKMFGIIGGCLIYPIVGLIYIIGMLFILIGWLIEFGRRMTILFALVLLRISTGRNIDNEKLKCVVEMQPISELPSNNEIDKIFRDNDIDLNGAMVILHDDQKRLCLLEIRNGQWCEGITRLPICKFDEFKSKFKSFTWIYR